MLSLGIWYNGQLLNQFGFHIRNLLLGFSFSLFRQFIVGGIKRPFSLFFFFFQPSFITSKTELEFLSSVDRTVNMRFILLIVIISFGYKYSHEYTS